MGAGDNIIATLYSLSLSLSLSVCVVYRIGVDWLAMTDVCLVPWRNYNAGLGSTIQTTVVVMLCDSGERYLSVSGRCTSRDKAAGGVHAPAS